MKCWMVMVGMLALVTPVTAEELPVKRKEVGVGATFRDGSWWVGTVATVVVSFPESVEPEGIPEGGNEVDFAGVEVYPADQDEGFVAVIRWLPRQVGLVTFPRLEFLSASTRYTTEARQLLVSAPQRTEAMALSIRPRKERVYVGEPLRVELRWSSDLVAKRQRALDCYPAFMSDPEIEVAVPRLQIGEDQQLGLPFGGRRVIARRVMGENEAALGEVDFPLFLRFAKPGRQSLSPTRLECAYLRVASGSFAPYAAYFNNALFEPVAEGEVYDRLFTESSASDIEVLSLPEEGRLESFSGLFAPCEIVASTKVSQVVVGEVLEVDLLLRSDAPHGMIELPDLSRQRSLRSWFKVDPELGRRWHPEGTLFRLRVRPLTTRIAVFPSLEIEVFDPQAGEYRIRRSEPIPLTVLADGGREYFDVKASLGKGSSLTDQAAGVWQNDRKVPMNEVLNRIAGGLADGFWLWLAAGPVLFFALLPWVRERRRRALDPVYRERLAAYDEFRKLPEGDPGKWQALLGLLASGSGGDERAWTSGDARNRLEELGLAEEDIELVAGGREAIDRELFSVQGATAELPALNGVGQRLFKRMSKLVLMLLAFGLTLGAPAEAATWAEAESAFEKALAADQGSQAAEALYSLAALKFEELAGEGRLPGSAWYNAGNAWFQAGEVGRAITGFRQAEIYRPFDPAVQEGLRAARALGVDVVEGDGGRSWWIWPRRWLAALLVPATLGFWILLLAFLRFRRRGWLVAGGVVLMVTIGLAGLLGWASIKQGAEGVVVVPEVYGRKGPSYRYETAFLQPLHDGLECAILERRDEWMQVRLGDGRRCWVPDGQVTPIRNPW